MIPVALQNPPFIPVHYSMPGGDRRPTPHEHAGCLHHGAIQYFLLRTVQPGIWPQWFPKGPAGTKKGILQGDFGGGKTHRKVAGLGVWPGPLH
jgi:hypothetical protein